MTAGRQHVMWRLSPRRWPPLGNIACTTEHPMPVVCLFACGNSRHRWRLDDLEESQCRQPGVALCARQVKVAQGATSMITMPIQPAIVVSHRQGVCWPSGVKATHARKERPGRAGDTRVASETIGLANPLLLKTQSGRE